MNDHRPLEDRLARVERAIADLSAEIAAIRAELRPGEEAAQPDTAVSESPRSPRYVFLAEAEAARSTPPKGLLGPHRLSSQELERLVGAYGMLGIAVLAAVAAVGTFLSWAISKGLFTVGPSVRVAIGLAFAASIGVWGIRLRRRERSFGSSLLGLSLVIVHVCAYAAGPSFSLVPTWVAFLGAAAASWALTVFAHRENDEPLWCVGFGGAAIAPFVTSNGHGSLYALLAYATLVLLSGSFSINKREWPVAWGVFYLASALFVVASAWEARNAETTRFLLALSFPLVVAVAGVAPLVVPSRKRGAIRWLALLTSVTGAYREAGAGHHASIEVGVLLAAMAICLALVDLESDLEQSSMITRGNEHFLILDWIDALLIPMFFTLEAAVAIDSVAPPWVVLGIASAVLAAFSVRQGLGGLRDASALGAVAMAVGAVVAASVETPAGLCASLVIIALAAFAAHGIRPSRSWLGSGAMTFFLAAIVSTDALTANPSQYHSAPFLRESSASAVILLVGLIIIARSWKAIRDATRASFQGGSVRRRVEFERRTLRAATLSPWVWAFIWVMSELALAFSPTASTLLLVTYFAATAVGCVAVGRSRSSSRIRQVGLGLAVVSAATAVYGANTYFDFGARIVAYLVISAFLLGIAYWYRRPGPAPTLA